MSPRNLQEQQKTHLVSSGKRGAFGTLLTLVILCLFCFTTLITAPSASAKDVPQLPQEPSNPKRHQVYFNTTDKHEYIYNGEEWVPHDASIDTYVLKKYRKPKESGKPAADGASSATKDSTGKQGASK